MSWQPIKTAPKDGTCILLAWIDRNSLEFRVERGTWSVGFQMWYVPSGLGVEPQWWDFSPPYPLPESPTEEKE